MPSTSEHILGALGPSSGKSYPLHDIQSTRVLEGYEDASLENDTLMQRAGKATASLALAVCPFAKVFWVACGPGNNGGDGYEAAVWLKHWGKAVEITDCSDAHSRSGEAIKAVNAASYLGIPVSPIAPEKFDVCIDAIFGIGKVRAFNSTHAEWIQRINASGKPVISVDVPTGLNADTGDANPLHIRANHTLSLLTLKPGLFTGNGRDACGEIWFNDLGIDSDVGPCARLSGAPKLTQRNHASHKGSYGDVCIVGGANGMRGAAYLAGTAALSGGAGRTYLSLLSQASEDGSAYPELMRKNYASLDLTRTTVVAGCGGGTSIAEALPGLIEGSANLVLDADALNQIARTPELRKLMKRRDPGRTVLTPHPLEAARLIGSEVSEVQSNRLITAQKIAHELQCAVVLKGSGTVIASPTEIPAINPTGNACLATAGTGDVLAGLVGAKMAAGTSAFEAARTAAYQHGMTADRWHGSTLTARALAQSF
jgi:hydroxyethylthiazole kinase-like uncharacterized protein yjeF